MILDLLKFEKDLQMMNVSIKGLIHLWVAWDKHKVVIFLVQSNRMKPKTDS